MSLHSSLALRTAPTLSVLSLRSGSSTSTHSRRALRTKQGYREDVSDRGDSRLGPDRSGPVREPVDRSGSGGLWGAESPRREASWCFSTSTSGISRKRQSQACSRLRVTPGTSAAKVETVQGIRTPSPRRGTSSRIRKANLRRSHCSESGGIRRHGPLTLHNSRRSKGNSPESELSGFRRTPQYLRIGLRRPPGDQLV